MLARTGKYNRNSEYFRVAKEAVKYTCTRQRPNGSWYYGEDAKYHWIDSFHTGYNLDALRCYIENTGDKTFQKNLLSGFEFFRKAFFESNGRPKYYHNRAYPIDIQCASQAIETLSKFADIDESALDQAITVAEWTIRNMQDESGYFCYRQYPYIKVKTPMIHWGQATMYKALTNLISVLCVIGKEKFGS